MTQIFNLTVDEIKSPLGLDNETPLFSYKIAADRFAFTQSAYRILVASAPDLLNENDADMLNTGKVISNQSVFIPYTGAPLASATKYYWTVKVWDENNNISEFSTPSEFEMGLLESTDWLGKWISMPAEHYGSWHDLSAKPAPYFRKEFAVNGEVVSARVYISGLGYNILYINGEKSGDMVLDPPVTNYDTRALYTVHDITNMLKSGQNAAGICLGTGWYNAHTEEVWDFTTFPWRAQPKVLAQIHVTYKDGTTDIIPTNLSWKVTNDGPIRFDGLRNGMFYDANMEITGWNSVGYNDSNWKTAELVPSPGGVLSANMAPCRVVGQIKPIAVNKVGDDKYVIDMGQNMVGWAKITASAPKGTTVTLRYSECLAADGNIDMSNIDVFIKSGEFQTDKYTFKGEGVETWEPDFTYHGFRYIEVSGLSFEPTLDFLVGQVVSSDFNTVGTLKTSNEVINKLQECTLWSFRGNFVGIPTDCPHREKNGWTGDALVATETGLFNFEMGPAYRKWLRDLSDNQRESGQLPGISPTGGWGYNWGSGPAWDSALVLIPMYISKYTGDASTLVKHYEASKLYIDYMTSLSDDYIPQFGLGDWCPPIEIESAGIQCPEVVTSTGYYYINAKTVQNTAELLGLNEDAKYYRDLAEKIKDAFIRHFIDEKTGIISTGIVTAQATPLFYHMLDSKLTKLVFDKLIERIEKDNYTSMFGILGAKYVMDVLIEWGRADVAYKILTQTSEPGWADWVVNKGATTLWEAWRGGTSHNHIMYGDISAVFYKLLTGINPLVNDEHTGMQTFRIMPYFAPDIDFVEGKYASTYGDIKSSWKRNADKSITLNISVPANTKAILALDIDSDKISVNNKNIDDITSIAKVSENREVTRQAIVDGKSNLKSIYTILSGDYTLTLKA